MKIATSPMKDIQLREIINYIVLFFISQNRKKAIVYYGWDCETENLYEKNEIDVSQLKSFIQASEDKKIFFLGRSDFYIESLKNDFEFLLCHESDVHFSSKNIQLAKHLEKDWKSKYKISKQKEGSKVWIDVK